jgi:hypothetical protein
VRIIHHDTGGDQSIRRHLVFAEGSGVAWTETVVRAFPSFAITVARLVTLELADRRR